MIIPLLVHSLLHRGKSFNFEIETHSVSMQFFFWWPSLLSWAHFKNKKNMIMERTKKKRNSRIFVFIHSIPTQSAKHLFTHSFNHLGDFSVVMTFFRANAIRHLWMILKRWTCHTVEKGLTLTEQMTPGIQNSAHPLQRHCEIWMMVVDMQIINLQILMDIPCECVCASWHVWYEW